MTTYDHETLREAIGAYVLGQLAGEIRAALEAHLQTCDSCRAEVAALRPLVAPLRALADPSAPPATLDGRVGRAIATAERARWVRYAATFAAGAAAATLVAVMLRPEAVPPPTGPPQEQVASVEGLEPIDATATLINHTWGTEIILVATGLRADVRYRVYVLGTDGRLHPSGGFVGVGETQMTCRLNSPVLRTEAAGFEVHAPGGRIVITGTLAS